MNNFHFLDHITLDYRHTPKAKTKYIDSVLKTAEESKKGLLVSINSTHASKVTGHAHYYAPAKVNKAADSFIKPYNKPVLPHHDTHQDALGRVVSATYVRTPDPTIPADLILAAEKDSVHNEKNLKYITRLAPYLKDTVFSGLGYLRLGCDITSPDAIEKVLDRRYLTVSVGYDTNSLHCSKCFADWTKESERCEHTPGKDMFFIFGDMKYGEVSFVNEPADDLAMVDDFKFTDSLRRTPTRNLITPTFISMYDSNSKEYIPINNPIGDEMNKIKELSELGQKDFYQKLIEFLPEEARLTDEQLEALEDSAFVGENKTFPAIDKAHIEACRKLIADSEDSDDKKDIEAFLETRELAIDNQSEPEVPVIEPTTEQTTEPETAEEITVKGGDFVNYEISINIGEREWEVPEDKKNPELEKALIELLLGAYCKTEDEAVKYIELILTSVPEAKSKYADSTELKAQIAKLRGEYKIAQDSLKAIGSSQKNTIKELKGFYVDQIVSLKQVDENSQTFKDELLNKSLPELKSAIEIFKKLQISTDSNGDKNAQADVSFQPGQVTDPTISFEDASSTVTSEDIVRMKDELEVKYAQIRTRSPKAADKFRANQLSIIAEHQAKLEQENNQGE